MSRIDHSSSLNTAGGKYHSCKRASAPARGTRDDWAAARDNLSPSLGKTSAAFVLEDQVGFLLRAVSQRNTVLFTETHGCRPDPRAICDDGEVT